jgi:hypothetical protein
MTNEEKRKIYAALAAPFPEHSIQRTEGRITGRGYDTSGPLDGARPWTSSCSGRSVTL